jgi:hypothetical protein
MIADRAQQLREDYIRLSERFKSLWTFQQFLRGVQKAFFASEPGTKLHFGTFYDDLRAAGDLVHEQSSPAVAKQIQGLSKRLDGFTAELREADRKISPSFVRRFFERVQPQDEKTALHLLRFYFSQSDNDADVVDKINFLATVAAAASSDPASSAARPENELRRIFELVTTGTVWTRPSDREATAIAYVVNEIAGRVAKAQSFEDLTSRGLIEEFRSLKRRTGESLAHSDVLYAVAVGNLTTRAAFSRFYRSEEKMLTKATSRIEDLERELRRSSGEEALPDELRRFQELRDRYRRGALDSNVRAQDVVQFKSAIGEVLQKFDRKPAEPAESEAFVGAGEEETTGPSDEAFWHPFVGRLLAAVEIADLGRPSAQSGDLDLESWEVQAVRRAIVTGGEPANDRDRTLLRAVALRVKAEEEAGLLRAVADGPSALELLRQARASIAHATELDSRLSQIARVAHDGGLREHERAWSRTRFRLVRAIADLWLVQDRPRPVGKTPPA